MSLQATIYGAIYDLAMGALNPGYNPLLGPLPTIPIIQDQQNQSAPCPGTYLALSGTPALSKIGTPDVGQQDTLGARNLDQYYEGTVTIWEVNGDGSKIQEIFDYSYTEAGQAVLDASPVSILEYGDIIDVAYKAQSAWVPQARATITVSVKSRVSETLATVETVTWASADFPHSGGSVEYPI